MHIVLAIQRSHEFCSLVNFTLFKSSLNAGRHAVSVPLLDAFLPRIQGSLNSGQPPKIDNALNPGKAPKLKKVEFHFLKSTRIYFYSIVVYLRRPPWILWPYVRQAPPTVFILQVLHIDIRISYFY